MSDLNYGVHGNSVLLGDGKTGVQSFIFENGTAGVVFCRDGRHEEPFSVFSQGVNDTDLSGENALMTISADNEKSLQVVIDRLEEAKQMLAKARGEQ